MSLSHDRMGTHIHVKTDKSPSSIKEMLSHCQEYEDRIYLASEISPDGKGYSFYIRKRRSLKDYILEKGLSFDELKDFIRAILDLISISENININYLDFIYDYSCIFIGKDLKLAEFVYAPRPVRPGDQKPIKELITLLSLHLAEYESKEERECLNSLLELIGDWEEGSDFPFPMEEIQNLMGIDEKEEGLKRGNIKPFLYYLLSSGLVIFLLFFFVPLKEKIPFILIGWLLVTVGLAYILLARKTSLKFEWKGKRIFIMYGVIKGRILTFDKEIIHIGRKKDWADLKIENLLVSRQHALISFTNKKAYIKDLDSKNGTYLNGERIKANEETLLKKFQIIEIGEKRAKIMYLL